MADADDYESAGADSDTTSFPTDANPVGKFYQVSVPSYSTATAGLNSYFRLGMPYSTAKYNTSEEIDLAEWDPSETDTQLGDDLLKGITFPTGFDGTQGGVRDHTDGNRVITTRMDKVELVKGEYRFAVLSGQSWEDEDPDWTTPVEGGEEETAILEHLYSSTHYKAIATTNFPKTNGASEYGEVRTKAADSGVPDLYEYTAGKVVSDIHCAVTSFQEKNYGGKVLELVSTIHKDSSALERSISDVSDGDIFHQVLGQKITEWTQSVGAYTIEEVDIADGGINHMTAAGGEIVEFTQAGANMTEYKSAATVLDISVGGLLLDLKLALAAIEIVLVPGASQIRLGPDSVEMHETEEKIKGVETKIGGEVTKLQGEVTHIDGEVTKIQGEVTKIQGEVTHIDGEVTKIQGEVTHLASEVTKIEGIKTSLHTTENKITTIADYLGIWNFA